MSTNYKKVAMSPEALPRQRLFQVLELPEPPADFEILDGKELDQLRPTSPGKDATLVVQAEWAWSPMHNRVSNWEIGLDETGQYWMLWSSYRTDEVELADWCDPEDDEDDLQWVAIWGSLVVGACEKEELSRRDASVLLLLQAWIDERDGDMELDRPHFYGSVEELGVDLIRSVEGVVWSR
jgi:hypothetical protein